MKVAKKELKVALQAAGRVDPRFGLAAGDFLLFVRDGVLSVRGCDLDMDIVWRLKAEGDGFSDVALPRVLQEFVAEMPDKALEMVLNGNVMTVSGNRQKGTFSVKATDTFPPTAKVEGPEIKVGADLMAVLDRVIVAASDNDMQPVLSGVLFEPGDNVLNLAAADGFRLAIDTVAAACAGPGFIVPVKVLKLLKRLLNGDDLIVRVDQGHVAFHTENFDLVATLIAGTYPEYRKLIPEAFKTTVTVDRRGLKRCVCSTCIVADSKEPTVKLIVNEKDMSVSATGSDTNKAEATLDVVLTGEPVKIAFNSKYLSEGLDAIPGDSVKLSIVSSTDPALMSGDGKYQYVIMPMYATW
jgi:DNA polymerase-3 subunit beta